MNDPESTDTIASAALNAAPLPVPPGNLQQRVRGRIRAQVMRTRLNVGLRAAVVLFVSVAVLQMLSQSADYVAPTTDFSAAEFDLLFAPPPIDPLLVLDRQQQIAWRALQHWESNR